MALSPFYDLLCTAVYLTVRKKFAFKLAGQMLWAEMNAKHLQVIEKELKLKNQLLSYLLNDILERMEKSLPVALAEMEKFQEKTIFEKIQIEILCKIKHFKSCL